MLDLDEDPPNKLVSPDKNPPLPLPLPDEGCVCCCGRLYDDESLDPVEPNKFVSPDKNPPLPDWD